MKKSIFLLINTLTIIITFQVTAYNQAIDNAEIRPDGIKVPTVNRNQVSNPIEGLLVYDINTDSFWYYEGTQWQEITGSSSTPPSLTELKLENNVGDTTVCLRGEGPNGDGQLILYQQNSEIGTLIDGGEGTQGGQMLLYNSSAINTFQIDAEGASANGFGSFFAMYQPNGDPTVIMDAHVGGSRGGRILLRDGSNATKFTVEADEGANNGGALKLWNGAGDITIELDAESGAGGNGRVITEELQITGGSDFSEAFNVSEKVEVKKGMVLCLDEMNEGELRMSSEKYDKKVVGIVSGANGVNTGIMMSDTGTIADGEFPIALAGRVYVKANEEGGDIQVGDFLTTSSERGIAMKAKNKKKAKGAIIGKAMSRIDENGFVLVLVNLQ